MAIFPNKFYVTYNALLMIFGRTALDMTKLTLVVSFYFSVALG